MPGYDFTEDDLREMVLRLAHEIRNPLATIESAVQLLEHLQQPDDEVAEFYRSIHAEVRRIDSVIRDMQRYVRLDSHTAAEVRIAAAVAEAVEHEASASLRAGSAVEVLGGPEISVLMDRKHLVLALRELVNNAIRFSPSGSTIRVGWRDHEASMCAIEVEDEGPGIMPEHEGRVLRPFFSTSTQGTGLGLNIAAKAGRVAGGELLWVNLAGGGARFTLILPRL